MEKLVFTYTNANVNKKKMKEKDGWFHVNIGALNAFNVHGELYLSDGIKEMINDPQTRIGQKLAMGYLKGEREHTKWEKNMTKMEYLLRLMHVEPTNVSHHIKSIEIEDTGIPVGKGFKGNILNLSAWIKPDSGPIGQILLNDLKDPEINVAFSIRSITKETFVNGIKVKKIENLVTFGWVFMPGIPTANKFDTISREGVGIGTESILSTDVIDSITMDDIKELELITNSRKLAGMESDDSAKMLSEFKNSLNDKPRTFAVFSKW